MNERVVPVREIIVPAMYGRSFEARAGEYVTVIDVDGKQVGDFVAFNAHDYTEWLSTAHTRVLLRRILIRQGDKIFTNRWNPMLEIVEDTVGVHDILYPTCDARRYLLRDRLPDHRGCWENIAEALDPYGISRWSIPNPIDIFQNSPVLADGTLGLEESLSRAGDHIVFRALMDVVGALSACPSDTTPANGYKITDLKIVISSPVETHTSQ